VYYSQKHRRNTMRRIIATIIAAIIATLTLIPGSASAGGGCHSDAFSDEANTEIELSKNCFEPTVARVNPGDTVTFNNSDPDAHAITGAVNSWGMTNGVGTAGDQINHGESVSYQFESSGVFPYYCAFHPSMIGAIVVGDGTATSAGAASDSVKAVSAEAVGGASNEEPEVVEEDSGGVRTVPVAIGVGVLAAIGGFARAVLLRRRSASAE
jgi:plastocyanin